MPELRPDGQYKEILQFSDTWFELGLLDESELQELGRHYDRGDDRNAEHYRYGVFQRYLAAHRPLPASMAEALYRLGEDDPDRAVGGAMMHDIVALQECPLIVEERALSTGIKHLARAIGRKRLLARIRLGVTDKLVDDCIAARDSDVQRRLLGALSMSAVHFERLSTNGSNKEIRHLARQQLRKMNRSQK